MYNYYVNGKWEKSKNAKIPFDDVGFLYGDGLFETMRFDNNKIFLPNNHINRLMKSLKIIDLKINKSKNEIINLLYSVINKNPLNAGIIRLMVTRGIPNNNKPGIYISIKPFYEIPNDPVKVIYLDESDYPIIRFTPAIKSMNYLGNMLAKKQASNEKAFEPIFYNRNNIITECAIRNIFYIQNEELLTPSLDLGILSGVMRDNIINVAKRMGISCKEIHIQLEDVNTMDEAFISSTGIGLLECYWNDWTSNYSITKQIKKELFKSINNN